MDDEGGAAPALPSGSDDGGGSESIRVCCRFRPIPPSKNQDQEAFVKHPNLKTVVIDPPAYDESAFLDGGGSILSDSYNFNFDQVFPPSASTLDVYNFLGTDVVGGVLNGYNSCLFVYGQTGSGKTHTMMGSGGIVGSEEESSDEEEEGQPPKDPDKYGLTPLIISDLFDGFSKAPESVTFTVRVSFVEVYLERVKDLLAPQFHGGNAPQPNATSLTNGQTINPNNLQLRTHPTSNAVYIQGVSEFYCSCEEDVFYHLERGNGVRAVGETKMNRDSSRSHSVFIVKVERRDGITDDDTEDPEGGAGVKTGQLYLVDLAGSESVGKTGADGLRLKEAQLINKSLSSLGNVINALSEGKQHVPYRDSKLTRMLEDCLGGNAKTTLVCMCSSEARNAVESVSTCRFGVRAKRVINTARINVEKGVEEYKSELMKINKREKELMKFVSALCRELRSLKEKIEAMQGTNQDDDALMSIKFEGPLCPETSSQEVKVVTKTVIQTDPEDGIMIERLQTALETTIEELQIRGEELAEAKFDLNTARMEIEDFKEQRAGVSGEIEKYKADVSLLEQEKMQFEREMKNSQYKEKEATMFLRQMRKEYRRLQQQISGGGRSSSADADDDGVGFIDKMMAESGLMDAEEEEMFEKEFAEEEASANDEEDTTGEGVKVDAGGEVGGGGDKKIDAPILPSSPIPPPPSTTPPVTPPPPPPRASESANSNTEAPGVSSAEVEKLVAEAVSKATAKSSKRETELVGDLGEMTRKFIDLRLQLEEEKVNVEMLSGSASQKKIAAEAVRLRKILERRSRDVQTALLKGQELHMMNKTLSRKLANREQHVEYLEASLTDLQAGHREFLTENQGRVADLETENKRLQRLVDALSSHGPTHSPNRVMMPIRGGGGSKRKTSATSGTGSPRRGSESGDRSSPQMTRSQSDPPSKKTPVKGGGDEDDEMWSPLKDGAVPVLVGNLSVEKKEAYFGGSDDEDEDEDEGWGHEEDRKKQEQEDDDVAVAKAAAAAVKAMNKESERLKKKSRKLSSRLKGMKTLLPKRSSMTSIGSILPKVPSTLKRGMSSSSKGADKDEDKDSWLFG
ncbi:hypothetical protein TrST_g4350 [Triparma strigata]|uniref:Kinesin motor domain-containing protein n=1 Tax=Triparma strigata TaxID=1606541 RepID=A0A9W7B3J9_9STRA|nr:hypothetical protein TrST_g4350 [Triparma strigata]